MNKSDLENLLQVNLDNIKDFNASDITISAQRSNSNSILIVNNYEGLSDRVKSIVDDSNYALLITNTKCDLDNSVVVSDINEMKIKITRSLYPYRDVKYIGVTGTNGKTSVTSILYQFLKLAGKNVLLFGTNGIYFNDNLVEDLSITTPDFTDICRNIHSARNVEYVIFEASSHSLAQNRFGDIQFDISAWTNFTQDHLDYHETMESYLAAKMNIVNITKGKILVCSDEVLKLNNNFIKSNSVLTENKNFHSGFMNDNYSLAVNILKELNVEVGNNDQKLVEVNGRFNIVSWGAKFIVIDYAHTPDALENLISQARDQFHGFNVVTLFGCGGDRDSSKRPLMGKVVTDNSDYVYITSDNPRTENPESVINDIIKCLEKENFTVEVDRKKAIHKALSKLQDNEVLLIAGKGSETYQDIMNEKFPFDDKAIVLEYINK